MMSVHTSAARHLVKKSALHKEIAGLLKKKKKLEEYDDTKSQNRADSCVPNRRLVYTSWAHICSWKKARSVAGVFSPSFEAFCARVT